MTSLFIATLFVPEPSTFVHFMRAVAEAGMIGGLADWFAVEALFRHPLGIPVPHTALLPKSKTRVARNIGDFIADHFLKPELIREKLKGADVASALQTWLAQENNARMVSEKLASVVRANLHETGPSEGPSFFKTMLRRLVMRPKTEVFIRKMVDDLMSSDLRDDLTDNALVAVKSLLEGNDETIRRIVQERSRWWIASAADDRFADTLLREMMKLIDTLLVRGSELRLEFDSALNGFTHDTDQDDKIGKTLQSLLLRLVDSENFDAIVATFIRGLKRSLEEDFSGDEGQTVQFIQSSIMSLAQSLGSNPKDLAALNDEISNTAGELVGQTSSIASDFIAATIKSWDEKEMIKLIEDQVGSDLQFIRMNGTLLGGLVGGILFFVIEFVTKLV